MGRKPLYERRKSAISLAGLALAGLVLDAGACSSKTPSIRTDGPTGGSGVAAGTGGTGAGAGTDTGMGGTGVKIDPNMGGGGMMVTAIGGEGGESICAGEEHPAELIPLDMYVMLDRSLSMYAKTSAGLTKWDAITEALGAFATDPKSEGIGVGLQYFPANHPCSADDECDSGLCYLKACRTSRRADATLPGLIPCSRDADCPKTGDSCVPLGGCGDQSCVSLDSTCSNDETCTAVEKGVCSSETVCTLSDYTTPEVPIKLLPNAADALIASLGQYSPAQSPYGLTPTGPALEGAIAHASDWAKKHPDRRVIVVLATDGAPTGGCTPSGRAEIAALAAVAAGADIPVRTFTVGVFAPANPDDPDSSEGPDTIRAIADAGKGQAFVISDQSDVVQEFADALIGIRAVGLSCDYQLPAAEDGTHLDYGKVNVEFTSHAGNEPETIPFVSDPMDCKDDGGWFYVKDDLSVPTGIRVCDATCKRFRDTVTGGVNIRIGCRTQMKPVVR